MNINFYVHGQPVSQGSMRALPRDDDSPLVLHDSSRALKAWREAIGWKAKEAMAGHKPVADEPVALSLMFFLERPPTVKRKQPHVKPDLDKLARAVLDALEGIVYAQDSQVVLLRASKAYAVSGPGLYVTVTDVP